MSGIVGIYNLDGRPVDPGVLTRAHQQIAHRGPDGGQCWNDGPVGLGHQQLCTTPESLLEEQPLEALDRALVLTADARIDNRTDLIRALGWTNRPATSITDADLILGAYKKWGTDCPEHLLGAFAFAIWDAHERRLFCARDHMGIKPFYYAHRPGRRFTFATEIKALTCQKAVPAEINEVRIADYLAHLGEDAETTFYRHIRRLPPAHALTVTADGIESLRRYWTLDPEYKVRYASDAEYEQHFLELFTEAVRCRLRTQSSPGVLVSGGLDSSSVTCVARKLLQASNRVPLDVFTGVFPSLPEADLRRCDERSYIRDLEAQGNLNVHAVRLDETSPLKDLDSVLWHLDTPPFVCNFYLHTSTHEAAQRQGVRVMLDGNGGDDAVSHGFGYLGELTYTGRWAQLEEEVSQLAARSNMSPVRLIQAYGGRALRLRAHKHPWRFVRKDLPRLTQRFDLAPWELLKKYAIKPHAPWWLHYMWRTMRGHDLKPAGWALLSDNLIEQADLYDRLRRLKAPYEVESVSAHQSHWLSIHAGAGVTSAGLEEINALAAIHNIERRHPFFDVRLLQFCVALPAEQKLRHGWARSILRRAMVDVLPESIRRRTDKADLSPNFTRNLQRFESARIDRLFDAEIAHLEPYVAPSALHRARQRNDSVALWHILTLAQWLRQREDKTASAFSNASEVQTAAAVP